MKLAILGPLQRGYNELRIMEEAKKVFDSVSYFPIPQLVICVNGETYDVRYKQKSILDYDAILPRVPRSYKTFGTNILHILKEAGKPLPIEPFSIIASHNKFLTLVYLVRNGIPVPETHLALKRSTLEEVLEEMEYPVVLKLLYGSHGAGVMFADSKPSALSIIDALERFKEPIFVEEYIESKGQDIRAYVVGGKVFASMKRIAREGERRSNIGMGGKGVAYTLSEKEKKLAEKAAKALGMKICGIDIMRSPRGPVVIETNVNAEFKGLEEATGKNVARAIVNYVREIAER